jgi:hypothetical protein
LLAAHLPEYLRIVRFPRLRLGVSEPVR